MAGGRKGSCPDSNVRRALAARIKKIMQKDEDVGKIAQASPVLIARAMELLLKKLCEKVAEVASSRQAKTITTSHLKACVMEEETMDFLKELVAAAPDLAAVDEEKASKPKRRRKAAGDAGDDNDDGAPTPTGDKPKRAPRAKKPKLEGGEGDGSGAATTSARPRGRKGKAAAAVDDDDDAPAPDLSNIDWGPMTDFEVPPIETLFSGAIGNLPDQNGSLGDAALAASSHIELPDQQGLPSVGHSGPDSHPCAGQQPAISADVHDDAAAPQALQHQLPPPQQHAPASAARTGEAGGPNPPCKVSLRSKHPLSLRSAPTQTRNLSSAASPTGRDPGPAAPASSGAPLGRDAACDGPSFSSGPSPADDASKAADPAAAEGATATAVEAQNAFLGGAQLAQFAAACGPEYDDDYDD